MNEVMTNAWRIAKRAAKKFGGKAVDYIAGALKMAWKETKKETTKMTEIKMVQFTINTSNKNGFSTWNSPHIFNQRVENFDTKDLQLNLYIGQHLNFDHVISDDGKLNQDDAAAWEEKYRQAPTGRSYDGFLQWCKDNDYIDDYTIEKYTVVEGNN